MNCALCKTELLPEQDQEPYNNPHNEIGESRTRAHRECLLRAVMGGIGHLRDHEYWCIQKRDPDGGMSYRDSAVAVDDFLWQARLQAGMEGTGPIYAEDMPDVRASLKGRRVDGAWHDEASEWPASPTEG